MPQMHLWPTSFQASDNVIVWREAGKILLGKKKNEPKWRVPGGFVDPDDESLEAAATREKTEEVGIDCECSRPEYAFSFRVPDPRYATGPDRIMSAVFVSYYLWGKPKAGDDIKWVRWLTKDYIRRRYETLMMPCHVPLIQGLIQRGLL